MANANGAERGRSKPRPKSPKQHGAAMAMEQRRERVAKLRVGGWSIREIAAEVGASLDTVHSDIHAVLDRTKDAADDAIKREREVSLLRLDAALRSIWPMIEPGAEDEPDDDAEPADPALLVIRAAKKLEAIDRLVKLDARRAKLLGLDVPAKQEVEVSADEKLQDALGKLSEARQRKSER